MFLQIFRLTGDVHLALQRVERDSSTLSHWKKKDPVFRKTFNFIKTNWEQINTRSLESLTTRSIRVIEHFLDNVEMNPVQALDAAKFQLKGVGVVTDKRKVEHTAALSGPIPIEEQRPRVTIVRPEKPAEQPTALVEGEHRELDEQGDDYETDES